jgi:hypothetical protein
LESEEDSHDNEEQEADDDDTGDEGPPMPTATPKRAAKPPKPAPKATPGAPKDGTNDDADMVDLAFQVRNNLNLNMWYSVDRNQKFPIFACVFVDAHSQTRYVYVRIELVGSIQASQVKAKLVQDGDVARVSVKFKKGGELTNPEHCLVQFFDCEFDETHPLYIAMKQVHRFYSEVNEEEEHVVHVYLPFCCDPCGFFDPINGEEGVLDLGIFPLPDILENDTPSDAPDPSTKVLHFICEELSKSKLEQKTKTRSYFKAKSPPSVQRKPAPMNDPENIFS